MSQNTRNVKRAYVEPPRQQATTDLKCQEVQGDFSLMINMAIKVNGESWNKSAERMCMCGYARARALPTTGPDTLYVHTPDHTERVGSVWYHLSCGLFCGLGINFCSLQPRAGFACDRGSFIHFGRPTHSGVPKVIRTQDMASLLRKTHSHSIPSDRSVADGVPELSKVASEKRASKERLSSATPTTDFKEKLRDMLINTGALTTLLFTMVTHGPNDLYNTSAAGAHPSC